MRTDLRRAALGGLRRACRRPARAHGPPRRARVADRAVEVRRARARGCHHRVQRRHRGHRAAASSRPRLAMELDGPARRHGLRRRASAGRGAGDDERRLGCIPPRAGGCSIRLTEARHDHGGGDATGVPSRSARRALEALTAHGLVVRKPQGAGKADRRELNRGGRGTLAYAAASDVDVPQASGISGTPRRDLARDSGPHTERRHHLRRGGGAVLEMWRRASSSRTKP
jgi:hypothetical protein